MASISAITPTNPVLLQVQNRINTFIVSCQDSKIYNLVVGQIMPVLAVTLSVGCAVMAFTAVPLMALGIVPLIALAILGVFATDQENCYKSFEEAVAELSAPPPPPFVPNQPIGLINRGNNCWANSLIQLAMNSPELEQKLRSHPVFSQIITKYREAQNTQQRVAPANSQDLRQYLHYYMGFRGGQIHLGPVQEDPADVLTFVLAEDPTLFIRPLYSLNQHNLITDVRTRDHRSHLVIDLEPGETFEVLFERFFETVAEPSESVPRPQPRLSTFDVPPPTLLIQLKRYGQTGLTEETPPRAILTRDNHSYSVPLSLTLPASRSSSNEAARYECDGFIEHIGTSLNGGHYVAYVKREGKWWFCSDSFIREAPLDVVQGAMQRSYIYSFKKA